MTSTSTAITATTTTTSLLCVVHHKSQSHVIPIPPSHRPIDELTKIIVIHSVSSLLWSVWLVAEWSSPQQQNKLDQLSCFLLLVVVVGVAAASWSNNDKSQETETIFDFFLVIFVRTSYLLFVVSFVIFFTNNETKFEKNITMYIMKSINR